MTELNHVEKTLTSFLEDIKIIKEKCPKATIKFYSKCFDGISFLYKSIDVKPQHFHIENIDYQYNIVVYDSFSREDGSQIKVFSHSKGTNIASVFTRDNSLRIDYRSLSKVLERNKMKANQ